MPRRKRRRVVSKEPLVSVYKPAGVPAKDLDEILISVDEFEAVRLADFEGLSQREACTIMRISQPTFNRTLASARSKIAEAIVEGYVLRIEGGNYFLTDGSGGLECVECGYRINMQTDDKDSCPKCGARLRWMRYDASQRSRNK
jgi:predicted DNA-binding protein (UPF0251 family)/predicted RNA-binding Zn-ribbon protein involved in translation (DUF1610 family)